MADYKLAGAGVIRESDKARIPASETNRDWRKYQAWLEGGGKPDPADPPPVPPTPAEEAESGAVNDPFNRALVAWLAKRENLTEAAVLAGITAEAKERGRP